VPIKETNVKKAVNVKYVLCAVDKANQILNGGVTTNYCNHTLAAETTVNGVAVNPAADTVAVKSAVDRLIAIGRTVSTILEDYNNGIYTWNGQEHGLPNSYSGQSVIHYATTSYNDGLSTTLNGHAAVYPTYYVQSMCSNTTGTAYQPGRPTYSSTGPECWCRLKRRSDAANAMSWLFYTSGDGTGDYCAMYCANGCAANVARFQYRAELFAAF
jgi:hypothetical protein